MSWQSFPTLQTVTRTDASIEKYYDRIDKVVLIRGEYGAKLYNLVIIIVVLVYTNSVECLLQTAMTAIQMIYSSKGAPNNMEKDRRILMLSISKSNNTFNIALSA